METIAVRTVEEKRSRTDKPYLSIETTTGKMSCWNMDLKDKIKVGHQYLVSLDKSSGYTNLVALGNDLGEVELPPQAERPAYQNKFGGMQQAAEMKKEGMLMSNCMNNATTYGISNNLSWDEIVQNALKAAKAFTE